MLQIYIRYMGKKGHAFNQGRIGCFLEGELWKGIYL